MNDQPEPAIVSADAPPPPPAKPPRKKWGEMTWGERLGGLGCLLVIIVAIGLAISLSRGGPPAAPGGGQAREPGYVSRTLLGDDWPLTVADGVLRCEPPSAVVFRSGGTDYAVNGVATSAGHSYIDPIWAAGASGVAPKKSIGPLIERGLALC